MADRRAFSTLHLLRFAVAVLAVAFGTAAATAAEVAPVVAVDGFYIEGGSDADPAIVGDAVFDARSAGGGLSIVVLSEEPPSGATTYADAVLDELPGAAGTILVVAPETVGWASSGDIWSSDELNVALDRSLDASTDDGVVTTFVDTLLDPPATGGGGGWILLIIAVIVVAGIGFFVWRSSRSNQRRQAQSLAELKAKANAQLAAVANDILDDEDEIAETDDATARQHFDEATAIYGTAAERLDAATAPTQVMDLSEDLDRAIWHLDAAEALLDGRPIPPKPEPPVPPPTDPSPPDGSTTADPGSGGLPTYQRRSSRRSSFGADDMLKTVLAMQAMRSLGGVGRRGRSAGTGGSSRSRSSGRTRSRGGGRRRS